MGNKMEARMKIKLVLLLASTALTIPPQQRAQAVGLPEDKTVLSNGDYARELSEARQLLVWTIAPGVEKLLGDQEAVSDLSRLILPLAFEAPTKLDEFETLSITEIDNLASGLTGDELRLYQAYVSSGRKDRLAELIRSIKRFEFIINNADASQYVPGIGRLAQITIDGRSMPFGEALVSSVTNPNGSHKNLMLERIRILTEALEKQESRQWEHAEPAVFKGLPLGLGPELSNVGGQSR
jgi:hypothetical protein